MDKEEKIEEIISRHLFSYGYERESIIKAMKEYAIAMCEEQKKECAENATAFLDANDNPIVAKGSILNTKNVAE
ncbi:hypothetical protein FKG96_12570 [Olivibacter sp. LS-1]|uniref:hypothetical protein n=1 Tax=Olivibacter sp. LS-1 TaxID=2592345 RepID=UPI0011EB6C8E|nr:hypothetical protein [Olivibacter sp. LS-1]QEL01606.1 hypothetical protein FKG96_12570 [Olivibacter sp. LS-1]